MKFSSQKGQILLIAVLVMVVTLTVGLAVASRSITNLRIAKDQDSSQRAFSAAEAGVERIVKTLCSDSNGCSVSGTFVENKTQFNTKSAPIGGTGFLLRGGNQIPAGDGADVWLSDYATDKSDMYKNQRSGNVTLYWGDSSGDCNNAALEVLTVSGSTNTPVTGRYVVDPCVTRRSNNFAAPTSGGTVATESFPYSLAINVPNGFLLRVVPLYFSTLVGVSGCDLSGSNCSAFPAQGQLVESTGQAEGTARKITFYQGFPEIPSEFFQYVLFIPK